jgi:hypothetical protein
VALSIKHDETEVMIRRLARQEGTTMIRAVNLAVQDRLQKSGRFDPDDLVRRRKAISDVQNRFAAGRNGCTLSDDEIVGYDENGAPN